MKKDLVILFIISLFVFCSCSCQKSTQHITPAKEGELCGGIGGIPCKEGLMCQAEETFPDSAGTCVKPQPQLIAKQGEMCGGIAGIPCENNLKCDIKETYPDAAGTCIVS